METLYQSDLSDVTLHSRGKVRDIYDLENYLLIVATDRLSAFDVVFPNPIPVKGIVLTQLSKFWFEQTSGIVENHLISADMTEFPKEVQRYREILRDRSMLVKKAIPLKAECVVRGYLDGSAYKDYLATGETSGVKLPEGMKQRDKFPEPLFTPATKAESGHDINISFEELKSLIDEDTAELVRSRSLDLYNFAHDMLLPKGLVLSDTKFEFGEIDKKIILIDECLTPDSSRFWIKDSYIPDAEAISLDKQYVRSFLEETDWDKTPPAPSLPREVVKNTTAKYMAAYELITGEKI